MGRTTWRTRQRCRHQRFIQPALPRTDGAGDRARIRVSITCQGDETVQMAVWAGRIGANGSETGKRLTSRSVHCGHDEDLYVVTSSAAITIGPTAGDGTVGWYAAAYSDLAARTP